MVVMVPLVLDFLGNSLSLDCNNQSMAYVFSSFLDLLHFILTSATHMLTTFDFFLAVAHAKEQLFFPESLPSPVLLFLVAL